MERRQLGNDSVGALRAPDWEAMPETGRRETLLRALQRLWEARPGPAVIVETGTLRSDSPSARSGDGWSTLAWGWYCPETGSRAWTVDVNRDHLEVCRRLTREYAPWLSYTKGDSVGFLAGWGGDGRLRAGTRDREKGDGEDEERGLSHTSPAPRPREIHLLYLDSLDYLDRERSEAHHMEVARAALPHLAPTCLVLLDDTSRAEEVADGPPRFAGKGARAIPFLREEGFRLEWAVSGQVLLSRGAAPAGARDGGAADWER
jgi:hypothetical protein